MMKTKSSALLAIMMTGGALFAASVAPDWNNVTVKDIKTQKQLLLDKQMVAQIITAPYGEAAQAVEAEIQPDGVTLRVTEKTEVKPQKVSFLLKNIAVKQFPEVAYEQQVVLSGPAGAEVTLLFDGKTAEGKHFYQGKKFTLSGEKETLSMQAALPAEMEILVLRVDFPGTGTFKLFDFSLAPAAAKTTKGDNR